VPAEVEPDEVGQSEPAQSEPAPSDVAQSEDAEDEAARSEVAEGEDAHDEVAEDEDALSGDARDGVPQGEVAQNDAQDRVADGDPDEGKEKVAASPVQKTATEQAAMALITALMRLRGALASSPLPLDVVGADDARQQQKAMLDQLDDYILPRLVQLEAPVLAVVGGSTGAGKSTLVNTLVGYVVSEPGVLRPTTRSPVLVHNPIDAHWFTGERVLPGLARATGESPGGHDDPGSIRLVAADTVPPGLVILDAPDVDSVVEANRELASQLLAAADLWLFVTTASRYADAIPWDFLRDAAERSTAVAVVLDRVPPDSVEDLTGHLAQLLLERGLGDSPLFAVPEIKLDGGGLLTDEVVAVIKDWLTELSADAEARAAVVRRTLQGAVTAMTKKTPAIAAAVRAQADTAAELRATAEAAYEQAVKDVAKASQDGTMLRGEVLARWQEFVGTGELLKGLQTNVGRLHDKVQTAVAGKPEPTRDLNDAIETGLESLLREHAEAAAERAEESWQSTVAGRQLLTARERELGQSSREFPAAASRAVRDWQSYVLELVRSEGADRRSTARVLAYGVNGLGLALMIVIFASTARITGAEVGVGAGTAAVGQKLLEAVFGDQAVRGLVAKARQDLDDRVLTLMDAEHARYLTVLDQHPVDPDAPRRLTEAARAVEDCT
jgi:energy-coupling factor transporter ATP-binding protein EcfA2